MQSADKGLCVRGASRELKERACALSLSANATSSSLLLSRVRTYMDFQSISDSRALVTKSAALAFPAAAARGFCQKPDAPSFRPYTSAERVCDKVTPLARYVPFLKLSGGAVSQMSYQFYVFLTSETKWIVLYL